MTGNGSRALSSISWAKTYSFWAFYMH